MGRSPDGDVYARYYWRRVVDMELEIFRNGIKNVVFADLQEGRALAWFELCAMENVVVHECGPLSPSSFADSRSGRRRSSLSARNVY